MTQKTTTTTAKPLPTFRAKEWATIGERLAAADPLAFGRFRRCLRGWVKTRERQLEIERRSAERLQRHAGGAA